MRVQVRLFASLREAAGQDKVAVELPEGATVRELVAHLEQQIPAIQGVAGAIYAAVNNAYVNPDASLKDGDTVALFPPVSGGQEGGVKKFEVTDRPISIDDVAARVNRPDCGAIVTFAGVVRGITGDMETEHLEYEAYAEMAEATMAQIGAEVKSKWPKIKDVAMVHRVGHMEVGEASVVIAVSSAHRGDGVFEACRYAIERLKEIVPIWKKEVLTTGAHWVEGPYGRPSAEVEPPEADFHPTPVTGQDHDHS